MRTVVITGSTSFIGHHLCQGFAERGWRVYATLSHAEDAYQGVQRQRLEKIRKCSDRVQLDVTRPSEIDRLCQTIGPDLWIHQSGYTSGHSDLDYAVECGMTINSLSVSHVFHALKDSSCDVIVTGTEAEYPSGDSPRSECMTGIPRSPYGITKLMGTYLAQQLGDAHGIATRITRVFLPVGLLDHPGKLIPQVVMALRENRDIDLSPCDQSRDFLAIDDLVDAYHRLALDMKQSRSVEIVNVASGHAKPVRQLLCEIADALGADHSRLRFGNLALRHDEPQIISADVTKLSRLGWVPKVSITTSLGLSEVSHVT